MVGIFKERNTFQVPFLFIIGILTKLVYILHPPAIVYLPHQGILTDGLNTWYASGNNGFLSAVLAVVINLGCAVSANALLMNQRMFSKTNLLVALSMVLMSSLIPVANILTAPLLLLPLLIWIYHQGALLYHSGSPKSKLFNIGIGIGVGTLLYNPFILVILVAMFALGTMRPFKLQEWLVLLMGLLAPYYFFFAYEFLKEQWHPKEHLPLFLFGYRHINHSLYSLLAYGTIVVWTMIGLYHWQNNLRRMLIQGRKNWNVILLLAAVCSVLLFVKTGNEMDAFALAVFPLGAFASSAFAYANRNFLPLLLFWLIIAMIILTSLRHYDGVV